MVRLGIYEYIRNIWFNLCVILIMTVMLLASVMLTSNMDSQTRLYRLTEKYLDEDSIFFDIADKELIKELDKTEGILTSRALSGYTENKINTIRTVVYTEEMMKYLEPMLDSGVQPDRGCKDGNTVSVIMSHNPYGIREGDTFTYHVFSGIDQYTDVNIYVAGILSEGQKIYGGDIIISSHMTYEDFFSTCSYEQSGEVVMIVTENELGKAGDFSELFLYKKGIVNLKDDISEEERDKYIDMLRNYELDLVGNAVIDAYPEAKDLITAGNKSFVNMIMKYIPLTIVVIILLIISIIGIVTVKTVKSARYYGIMYACGMHYKIAEIMTGIEMGINCLASAMVTVSLLQIQNKLKIVGELNCRLKLPEITIMVIICVFITICSATTIRSILRENTPVKILKETL